MKKTEKLIGILDKLKEKHLKQHPNGSNLDNLLDKIIIKLPIPIAREISLNFDDIRKQTKIGMLTNNMGKGIGWYCHHVFYKGANYITREYRRTLHLEEYFD